MSTTEQIAVKDFAARVERLCDYFLSKIERNGSSDRKVLEDLKEISADIQFDRVEVVGINSIEGLHDFMLGP